MIELNLNSNPGLLLLEPYQWALACQAVAEGLAHHEGDAARRNLKMATPQEIATALQLLVLNDHIAISYLPLSDPETLKKQRAATVNLEALGKTGLVQLASRLEHIRYFTECKTSRDRWLAIRPHLQKYESFILAQFKSRNYNFAHWAIYRYLIAIRTDDQVMADLVEPSIQAEHRDLAREIATRNPPDLDMFATLDMKFFNAVGRVQHAFSLALSGEARVVGASPALDVPGAAGKGPASEQIWRIVASSLIEEDIVFPVPKSFNDVLRLRSIPEVRAFREFVGPFVDKFVAGDDKAYRELKREIKAAVRGFNRLPLAKTVLDFTTYAAVPISVYEAMTGKIGPSIATGAAAIGLTKLTRTWQERSRWLYLSSDCQTRE